MVQCGHNILNDYEKSFKKTVLHPKSMKISQAYVIHYVPNESVEIFENYTETNVFTFNWNQTERCEEFIEIPHTKRTSVF